MTAYAIMIDRGVRHQIIDNFGANDCWSMQHIGRWSDTGRNRVADLLFSRDKGIGLSSWRFNLGAGYQPDAIGHRWRTVECFETGEGVYDWARQSGARWFLSAAKARGVDQFIAFVNSPPARLTRNGLTHCSPDMGSTNLKDGAEQQFARYCCDVLKHFRDNPDESERIAFDWLSPVNEPEWDWNGNNQEGNRASNQDIRRIVVALREELRRQGLDTKILTPECGALPHMHAEWRSMGEKYGGTYGNYLPFLTKDPAIRDVLAHTVCTHSYWSDAYPGQLVPHRQALAEALKQYPGWSLWQTEYCVMQGPEGAGGGGRDLTMKTALDVLRLIHCDLTILNASAWQWWLAVSESDYKDGLVFTDYRKPGDEENILPSKLLWCFGHFSRFVRPGAVRIGLQGADDMEGLMASAYLHEGSGELTVVLINFGARAARGSLELRGLVGVDSFTPYITSDAEGDDIRELPPVRVAEGCDVPARSVVTLTTRV